MLPYICQRWHFPLQFYGASRQGIIRERYIRSLVDPYGDLIHAVVHHASERKLNDSDSHQQSVPQSLAFIISI